MKHEHRHGIDAFFRRSQGAHEPLEFTGLQIFTDVGGQLLNGRCRLDLLDGDGALGAFGKPFGDLGRSLVVDLRQFVEDATRRLAGDDGPGGEGDAFGSLPGRDVGTEGLHDRLLAQHLAGDRGRRLGRRSGDGVRSGRVRRRWGRRRRRWGRRRCVRLEFGMFGGKFGRQFRR